MLGYLIGLGDWHLNNIKIHYKSGIIFNIDYKDVFDVNKNWEKLPEKVPFRLTDVLTSVFLCPQNYL